MREDVTFSTMVKEASDIVSTCHSVYSESRFVVGDHDTPISSISQMLLSSDLQCEQSSHSPVNTDESNLLLHSRQS